MSNAQEEGAGCRSIARQSRCDRRVGGSPATALVPSRPFALDADENAGDVMDGSEGLSQILYCQSRRRGEQARSLRPLLRISEGGEVASASAIVEAPVRPP